MVPVFAFLSRNKSQRGWKTSFRSAVVSFCRSGNNELRGEAYGLPLHFLKNKNEGTYHSNSDMLGSRRRSLRRTAAESRTPIHTLGYSIFNAFEFRFHILLLRQYQPGFWSEQKTLWFSCSYLRNVKGKEGKAKLLYVFVCACLCVHKSGMEILMPSGKFLFVHSELQERRLEDRCVT